VKYIALGVGLFLLVVMSLPVFLMMGGSPASAQCGIAVATADGSPTIMGPASLSAAQITTWWTASYGQTTPIGVPVATMVGWYLDHGAAEGVRGDYALAQAIVETFDRGAPFGSDHAKQYNFAGIGVSSNTAHGFDFPTPEAGVIAQMQLLAKVVSGNSAQLSEPNVAPTWGGKAGIPTWAGLAGNWATNPEYWISPDPTHSTISYWYTKMGGVAPGVPATLVEAPTPTSPGADGATPSTSASPGAGGCGAGGGPGPGCVTGIPTASASTSTPASVPTATDPLAPMWSFLCAQLGKPYLWGGTGPNAWDCSGLVQAAEAQVGVTLPRTSELQYGAVGAHIVPPDQLQPGDLVFFEGVPPGHVGIIVKAAAGPGQLPMMEDAPQTGAFVEIVPLWASAYVGAGRSNMPVPA
jgi:cell wall-associated NlpC family hydrolase